MVSTESIECGKRQNEIKKEKETNEHVKYAQ